MKHNLHEKMQSTCRRYHSTKEAVFNFHSVILQAIKNGFILVLLVLRAVFDFIDHDILIQRLNNFGINGDALDEFRRVYCIQITMCHRKEHIINLYCLHISHTLKWKILLLVYMALNCIAPDYINDMVVLYKPTLTLLSSGDNLLAASPLQAL